MPRPKKYADEIQKKRSLMLSDRYMEMAKRFGNGLASEGIRRALDRMNRGRKHELDE